MTALQTPEDLLRHLDDPEARKVTDAIYSDVIELHRSRSQGAVIGAAPAGGGKTHFVVETAGRLVADGLLVFICTPTNKQARELTERLIRAGLQTSLIHGRGQEVDMTHVDGSQDIFTAGSSITLVDGTSVVVSTVAKMGDAVLRTGLTDDTWPDVLILDEAFQVKSSEYLRVADMSDVHLLVGDPGQLEPFTTLRDTSRWRGSANNPVQDAVATVLAHHPDTPVHRFPVTRRLDQRGVHLIRPFYETIGHPVRAALPDHARSEYFDVPDPVLGHAAETGVSYVTLPDREEDDPAEIADKIAEIARSLVTSGTTLHSERGTSSLDPARILVGVSTNDERRLVEDRLVGTVAEDVTVLTANKAQGLEFDVSLVWHPLAGAQDVDEFRLSTGRLCVLLSRHRHMCVVVGRESDHELLDGQIPDTTAFPSEGDKVLEGWFSHEHLFDILMDRKV